MVGSSHIDVGRLIRGERYCSDLPFLLLLTLGEPIFPAVSREHGGVSNCSRSRLDEGSNANVQAWHHWIIGRPLICRIESHSIELRVGTGCRTATNVFVLVGATYAADGTTSVVQKPAP